MTKEELLQSAQNGNIDAMMQLALVLRDEHKPKEAIQWVETAARTGNPKALGFAASFLHIEAAILHESGSFDHAEELFIKCIYYIDALKRNGHFYDQEAAVKERMAELYLYNMNRSYDALPILEDIKDSGRPYAASMLYACHFEVGNRDINVYHEDIERIRRTIENDGWPKLSQKAYTYELLATSFMDQNPFESCNYYRKAADARAEYAGTVQGEISSNMPPAEMKKLFDKTEAYCSVYRKVIDQKKQIQAKNTQQKNSGDPRLTGFQWLVVILAALPAVVLGIILYFVFRSRNKKVKPDENSVIAIKYLDELSRELLHKAQNTGLEELVPVSQLEPFNYARIYEDFKRQYNYLY